MEAAGSALGNTSISVQVLQEMHVNLVKQGTSPIVATRLVHDFSVWPIVENSVDLLHAALNEQARWQLSLWNSLILAAARSSGATRLISEDLSNGQDYGGVRVISPFV